MAAAEGAIEASEQQERPLPRFGKLRSSSRASALGLRAWYIQASRKVRSASGECAVDAARIDTASLLSCSRVMFAIFLAFFA